MKNNYKSIFENKVDAIGLSIFRILYALILFCEALQLYKFRHIIYDKDPFKNIGEINIELLFYFWFIVIVFLIFGLFTRFSTILNYVFGVIIFSSACSFEYHVFYAFVGINFLLLFMPISRVFSLDSLIQKLKYSTIGREFKIDRKVLEINYLIPVFVAIALVYFDSFFKKIASDMWRDGLGVWLPSSMPMAIWNDTSFILNQEGIIKFLGYFVIIFEGLFIFLFWFKKLRVPILLIGLFFHLGILITYPIPWFALTVIVVYLLLIPQNFWLGIKDVFKSKTASLRFYYDAECPLFNKVVVLIKHIDIFNKIECLVIQENANYESELHTISEMQLLTHIYGVNNKGKVFVGYDCYVQLFKKIGYTYPLGLFLSIPGISLLGNKIYNYIVVNSLTEKSYTENYLIPTFFNPIYENQDFLIRGFNQLNLTKSFWKFVLFFFTIAQSLTIYFSSFVQKHTPYKEILNVIPEFFYNDNSSSFSKTYLGLTFHPVFMKQHFRGYNHIFKIVCEFNNKIVPIVNDDGMIIDSYANGALWVNYTFRVSSQNLNINSYEHGILPYLRHYMDENNIKDSCFKIYVKEIEVPEHWEKDFLHKQMKKTWQEVGQCVIAEKKSNFIWSQRMKTIFASEK